MIEVASVEALHGEPLSPWLGATLRAGSGVRLLADHCPGFLCVVSQDAEPPRPVHEGDRVDEFRVRAPSPPEPETVGELPLPGARVPCVSARPCPAHLQPTRVARADSIKLTSGGVVVSYRSRAYFVPTGALAYLIPEGNQPGETGHTLIPLESLRVLVTP